MVIRVNRCYVRAVNTRDRVAWCVYWRQVSFYLVPYNIALVHHE